MHRSLRFVPAALILSALAVACGDDDDAATPKPNPTADGGTNPNPNPTTDGGTTPATKDIVDTAVGNENFKLLAAALTRANLVGTLKGTTTQFTVLAPTNAAFEKAGLATEAAINAVPVDALAKILQYHVIAGRAPASAVIGLTSSDTLADGIAPAKLKIRIAVNGTEIKIFPTKDLSAGAPATPDTGAIVGPADVQATNGIIHAIDTVLTPPSKDIVGAASAYPILSSLVTTLGTDPGNPGGGAATLVATLQGAGPFTVFAPNNQAFMDLGAPPAPAALRNVLLYHVAPGFLTSGDVVKAVPANTAVPTALTGKTLSFIAGPKVKDSTAGGADLVATDIVTTNGIVHVVGKVLIPAN